MTLPLESDLRDALSGQYELMRELGRGGMGVVYLAHDVRLDRPVAIKVLPQDLNSNDELHERFLREARTAARLSHPNIVPIYRADEIDGRAFFVMAYVDGKSLGERVFDSGAVAPVLASRWIRDVALALGYAHASGVVHRDVKPENILIDNASGRAMVADFGIARVAQASRLTSTGQVLGSVHFMSPEQVTNEPLDGRSDLYSLGAVAFYALSGTLPFSSEAAAAVLVAHVTTPAPSLRSVAPGVPASLCAIVDRCLKKDPALRYRTGDELASALEATPMTDIAPEETIGESDAQRLWKRASELQAEAISRGVASDPAPTGTVPLLPRRIAQTGYKLDDAVAAAIEAGVSGRYVALALDELKRDAKADVAFLQPASPITIAEPVPLITGAPMLLEREAVVPGEVTTESFELFVETIQRTTGETGHVTTLGRSLAWSAANQSRKLQVTVSPRKGRTTIRVSERQSPLAGGLFGGVLGGVGGGVGAPSAILALQFTHSVPIALGVGAGVVAAAYLLARTIFVSVSSRRIRDIDTLVQRLASHAAESAEH
ncbi:MAG: serine/threonine protein kinase [Gemmatimonadota bacterium]|nr:serine/threonine protein kinase [Gemmatimonadota bacterium]